MNMIKNSALRLLPKSIQNLVKKFYYPRVVRSISEEDWPYSIIVKNLIQPGDKVIDIGANIGYVSALLARWVETEGHVYSLEPIPETFNLLRNNLLKLGHPNMHQFCVAASACEGQASMEIPEYSTGGENYYQAHIVPEDKHETKKEKTHVELRRLDLLFKDILDDIVFIKIDVEGHELEVLQGGEKLISQSSPSMVIEVDTDPDKKGTSGYKLFIFLGKKGYEAYVLEQGKLRLRRTGDKAVDYFFLTPFHVQKLSTKGFVRI